MKVTRRENISKRPLLRAFRGKRTQEEMAAMYGTIQQQWSQWENGKGQPKISIMMRLANDSGIPVEKLFPDVFKEPVYPSIKIRLGGAP